MPEVLILSGPPGSGKTTVAQALAERYDRVAHIPIDIVNQFITPTGRVSFTGPAEAAARQEALNRRNACCLACNFIDERFAVILDGVVVQPEDIASFVELLKPAGAAIHYAVLMPRLEVCLERNRQRKEGRVSPQLVKTVYGYFQQAQLQGPTIDSSDLTPHEAADKLQALTTSGQSLIWQPEPGKTAESNAR